MKTNLLTLFLFFIASAFYSCSKETEDNNHCSKNNDTPITTAQRTIIISNCSSHSGCHSGSRVVLAGVGTLNQANSVLKHNSKAINPLSLCDRSKLQDWFQSEK